MEVFLCKKIHTRTAVHTDHWSHLCEHIRLGLDEEFLAAAAFVEAGQQSHDLRREKFFGAVYEIKFVHSAYGLQGEDSVFLPQKRIFCIKIKKMMQKAIEMR